MLYRRCAWVWRTRLEATTCPSCLAYTVTDDRCAIPAHDVAEPVTVPIAVGVVGLHAAQKAAIAIDAATASPIPDRIASALQLGGQSSAPPSE